MKTDVRAEIGKMGRVYVPCINLTDLIAYTDWQREKWQAFLRAHRETLQTSAGPNGDGRFTTVGDLVRHIFSAEKRYIDRLSNSPLTDPAAIPSNDVAALFALGRQSRDGLIAFLKSFPDSDWGASKSTLSLTTRCV